MPISLFPETGTGHLTVGKLYGGILIYDNWKKTKFGQIEELRQQEAELEALEKAAAEEERLRLRQEAIDRGDDPDEVDRELERQRAQEAGEGGGMCIYAHINVGIIMQEELLVQEGRG